MDDTREIRTRASGETRTLPWRLRPTRPEYPIPEKTVYGAEALMLDKMLKCPQETA